MDKTIYVVSGLPRSGTSMMMQVLKSANYEILSDEVRLQDSDNQLGYYEYELVKQLPYNQQWLGQAVNKVVKVISHLLYHLPAGYSYRIIFMERYLDEVITSQNIMLKNRGKTSPWTLSQSLRLVLEKHISEVSNWCKKQKNIDIHYVQFNQFVFDLKNELYKLGNFLSKEFNFDVIREIVRPDLYRNKICIHDKQNLT